MTVTLFVGDLHGKTQLLDPIARTADRVRADRLVLLGDICDDWTLTDQTLSAWTAVFATWVADQRTRREVIVLVGNHDAPYLVSRPSALLLRSYGVTPGFHPGAHHVVHATLATIGMRVAWSDGRVLASHAGVTRTWLARHDMAGADVRTIADTLNQNHGGEAGLVALAMTVGVRRGGSCRAPSPLWADSWELMVDGAGLGFTQVVGHSPVPTVTESGGNWFCDTFSTDSAGQPLGDQSMLVMDDGGFRRVSLEA